MFMCVFGGGGRESGWAEPQVSDSGVGGGLCFGRPKRTPEDATVCYHVYVCVYVCAKVSVCGDAASCCGVDKVFDERRPWVDRLFVEHSASI